MNTALINSWVSGASEILIFNITLIWGLLIQIALFKTIRDSTNQRKSRESTITIEQNTENDFCIIELFIK